MNWTPLYIIPGLTFLFWAVVHSLLASRTRDYPILFLLMMAVFLTAAGDVIIGTVFESTTVAHLIVQLTAPAIIPITCLYFARMWRDEVKINAFHVLWLSIPVVMFTASAMLAGINGLENTDAFLARIHNGGSAADAALNKAESAFYLWTIVVFRLVMGIQAIFMLAYCIFLGIKFRFRPRNLYNYLSNKRWRIRVLEVQVSISIVILLGLCIKIYLHHPAGQTSPFLIVLLLVLSVMQFLFGYFALFGSREFISREDIRTAFRFNYREETASAVAEDIILNMVGQLNGEAISHVMSRLQVHSGAFASVSGGGKTDAPSLSSAILGKARSSDALTAQFQQLMMGEQLFLQPGLSLADVAERLHTNKTYVSKMVNQTYNLGFPEVMNILRVDYAETYIRKHPDATQEEVAKACGFVSASSFNSTFKRITGYTPKVWAARI